MSEQTCHHAFLTHATCTLCGSGPLLVFAEGKQGDAAPVDVVEGLRARLATVEGERDEARTLLDLYSEGRTYDLDEMDALALRIRRLTRVAEGRRAQYKQAEYARLALRDNLCRRDEVIDCQDCGLKHLRREAAGFACALIRELRAELAEAQAGAASLVAAAEALVREMQARTDIGVPLPRLQAALAHHAGRATLEAVWAYMRAAGKRAWALHAELCSSTCDPECAEHTATHAALVELVGEGPK